MQDPRLLGGAGGGAAPAGGDPGAGGGGQPGGDPGAGGGAPELTSQQMMDSVSKILGAEEEGVTEEQEWRIRQEARNMVSDIQKAAGDELPEATTSQINTLVDGIVNTDPVKIINAVRDAMKVAEETQANEKRSSAGSLKVQGTGDGKGQQQQAPRSMNEAILNAARSV